MKYRTYLGFQSLLSSLQLPLLPRYLGFSLRLLCAGTIEGLLLSVLILPKAIESPALLLNLRRIRFKEFFDVI